MERPFSESQDDDFGGAFVASDRAGQASAPITAPASTTPLAGLLHADLLSRTGADASPPLPPWSAPSDGRGVAPAASAGSPEAAVLGGACSNGSGGGATAAVGERAARSPSCSPRTTWDQGEAML